MKKKFLCKCLISLGLLLFFTFLPQIIPTSVSIARATEIEKEKNNEYRLNLRTITLVNGKSFTLKVYNLEEDAKVSFKSADPEIASINKEGTFTAHKVGTTTITATVRRGLNSTTLTCEVTIGPPAFSVKMTRSLVVLGLDQSDLLEVIMKPSNTAELAKFSSFDSSIASVSSGGRITAKKLGMTYVFAEIDATYQDGSRKFASCSVIVTNPEEVTLLTEYFNNHYELSMISDAELTNALYEFFNSTDDTSIAKSTVDAGLSTAEASSSSSNASQANEVQKSVSSDTKSTTKALDNNNNIQQDNGKATNTSEANAKSGHSLIESLDNYLNSRFDLAQLRQKFEERLQPTIEIQLSSLYGNLQKR